jgi:hypothetical protein
MNWRSAESDPPPRYAVVEVSRDRIKTLDTLIYNPQTENWNLKGLYWRYPDARAA